MQGEGRAELPREIVGRRVGAGRELLRVLLVGRGEVDGYEPDIFRVEPEGLEPGQRSPPALA